MFKFVKGCNIQNSEGLTEGYTIEENAIRSNVEANKIEKLMQDFIDMQDKEAKLFLFIEVPCNLKDEKVVKEATDEEVGIIEESTHNDVYYMDGIPQEVAGTILKQASELLINDGLVIFGFGNHFTGDEIGKYKYNEVVLYFKDDIKEYEKLYKNNKIKKVDDLISPWDLINKDNPGVCDSYKTKDGMDVYDLIEAFDNSFEEFYKAEKRED